MDQIEYCETLIRRNVNVLDKAPEDIREKCMRDIKWAQDLTKRLNNLDYDQRDVAVQQIHSLLDEDYQAMGFSLEQMKR